MQSNPKQEDRDTTWAHDQKGRSYYYDDAHGYIRYDPAADPTIYTIGHSTLEFEQFVRLLSESGIDLLADVRSFPGSRKFPQFNKESLEVTLPPNGIEYLNLKKLGGRRKVRKDSRNTIWRNESFRGYADYMETDEFLAGIQELIELAEEHRTVIMCSEALWWRCHRSMISDHLKATGAKVLHILSSGKTEEHPYTSAATILDGVLTYGEGSS